MKSACSYLVPGSTGRSICSDYDDTTRQRERGNLAPGPDPLRRKVMSALGCMVDKHRRVLDHSYLSQVGRFAALIPEMLYPWNQENTGVPNWEPA